MKTRWLTWTVSATAIATAVSLAGCSSGDSASTTGGEASTEVSDPTIEINADCSRVREVAGAVLRSTNMYVLDLATGDAAPARDVALADLAQAADEVQAIQPTLTGEAGETANDLLEDLRDLEQKITNGEPQNEVTDDLGDVSEELAEFLRQCAS